MKKEENLPFSMMSKFFFLEIFSLLRFYNPFAFLPIERFTEEEKKSSEQDKSNLKEPSQYICYSYRINKQSGTRNRRKEETP